RAIGHVDVPHPIEPASPRLGRIARPRNEVAKDVSAGARLANCERLVEEPDELCGRRLLLERTAPGDVAGVASLDFAQQMAARLRLRAVRANQEVSLDLAVLRKAAHDPSLRLGEPG